MTSIRRDLPREEQQLRDGQDEVGVTGGAQRRSLICEGERGLQGGGTTSQETGAVQPGGHGHLSNVKLNGEQELPAPSLSTWPWGAPALQKPLSRHMWNQGLGFAGPLKKLNFALVRSKFSSYNS